MYSVFFFNHSGETKPTTTPFPQSPHPLQPLLNTIFPNCLIIISRGRSSVDTIKPATSVVGFIGYIHLSLYRFLFLKPS
jgi:hypothetical protein